MSHPAGLSPRDVMLSVAIHGPIDVPRGRWSAPYTYQLLGPDGPTGPVDRESADRARGPA